MLPSGFMSDIGSAVAQVHQRMAAAAARAGRDPSQIELMAVSKTVPPESVRQAVEAGVGVLGENRVQAAERKISEVGVPVQWHLIGRLQSNKARLAAALFDAVHSVDREGLVERLDAGAKAQNKRLDVYVQVEFVRSELTEHEILSLAERVCRVVGQAASLHLCGLMTLPPFDPDPEAARPWFRRLSEIRGTLRQATGMEIPGLSMGMSNDFEVAIEEGATIVRVGTTIFGSRASAVPNLSLTTEA